MATDLPHDSVALALRNLNTLEEFTYVPPFRGRAIRMVHRDLSFNELDIDFQALQRRKEDEREKLRKVIYFALSERCRQQTILTYFGEKNAQSCGHCDNCRNSGIEGLRTTEIGHSQGNEDHSDSLASSNDEKILEAVRIVLSGVARIKKEKSFDCGKNLIAQMLCGSGSARIEKLGLNDLSTFGLLKHLRQTEVAMLIEGLIVLVLLRQESLEPGRPVVQLTEAGIGIMSGKDPLQTELPIPGELSRKITGHGQPRPGSTDNSAIGMPQAQEALRSLKLQPTNTALLARLKAWRKQRAEEANLPAYCILHNSTIEEIASLGPRSSNELLKLNGMGPKRVEQYGDEILAIVANSE
jgi:ATP-dependent DNA helicase RecQ